MEAAGSPTGAFPESDPADDRVREHAPFDLPERSGNPVDDSFFDAFDRGAIRAGRLFSGFGRFVFGEVEATAGIDAPTAPAFDHQLPVLRAVRAADSGVSVEANALFDQVHIHLQPGRVPAKGGERRAEGSGRRLPSRCREWTAHGRESHQTNANCKIVLAGGPLRLP